MAFLFAHTPAVMERTRLILSDVTNVQKAEQIKGDKIEKPTHSESSDYVKMTTLEHVTSFTKAKAIFCCRHLKPTETTNITDHTSANTLNDVRPARSIRFQPVLDGESETTRDSGNVRFTFRVLNGPKGIWNGEPECGENAVFNAEGHLISPKQSLRYFLITDSDRSQILITRCSHDILPEYDPLASHGPWRLVRNSVSNEYEHLISTKEPRVEFVIDESVFSANSDYRVYFSESLEIGFTDTVTSSPEQTAVDSHPVTGPLRLTLAASSYRWPGGIHLTSSGQFQPDRAIKRFEAYHARLSREVLVSRDDSQQDVPQGPIIRGETVEHWIHSFRQCKYAPTREMCDKLPDVVSNIRFYLREMSAACATSHKTTELRKTLQAFVLFLAANCLDKCTDTNQSQPNGLWDFDVLYKFVLNLLPDARCHHVLRDCVIRRLVKALDGNEC